MSRTVEHILRPTEYDQRYAGVSRLQHLLMVPLIHTGQRVTPLSHCAFMASLQAELRITLATTLAPCLNSGHVSTPE